jgi:Xaa-Pro aminopeptidase
LKSDLDQLMTDRGHAALLVLGGTAHNPPMYYLANGANIGERSVLVKKRGEAPVLFVDNMERDEARCSGLRVIDQSSARLLAQLRETGGDRLLASARWIGGMLREAGVMAGTVAAYGAADAGAAYGLLTALSELHPQLTFVGEFDDTLLQAAMITKDPDEVRRIRAVGKKTMRVVAGTEEFLTSHRARGGYLAKKDGTRLTIGDVKRRIRQMLNDENLVDAENGTIFSIGREAGVPHSRGTDRDPLALGQTIVYDIFPAEPGGGYFFDFTRTWCLGYASPEVEQAYADVLATFKAVVRALRPGELCGSYQALTCQLLEARGHATIGGDPSITSGYVHSVAHGVGLHIHEAPRFSDLPGNQHRLVPGVVITVEPGLYYPERGYGIRIEDCLWLNPKSLKFEALASYRKDLVLKIKGVARSRSNVKRNTRSETRHAQ